MERKAHYKKVKGTWQPTPASRRVTKPRLSSEETYNKVKGWLRMAELRRRQLGLTKVQVRKVAGLSHELVNYALRGNTSVQMKTLLRVLDAVDLELILRKKERKNPLDD